MAKIKATLISEKVTSNTAEAHSLFTASRFGEKLGEKILYSLSEALYLVQDKKMDIYDYRDNKLLQKEILKKLTTRLIKPNYKPNFSGISPGCGLIF